MGGLVEGEPIRRMPVDALEVEIEYKGVLFHLKVRDDPKLKTIEKLTEENRSMKDMREGLAELVLDWDLVDEEGNPFPPPSGEAMAEVPTKLLTLMVQGTMGILNNAPNA